MAQHQIVITFDDKTDQLMVIAPFAAKMLCYGMMERAKDIIRAVPVAEVPVEKKPQPAANTAGPNTPQ